MAAIFDVERLADLAVHFGHLVTTKREMIFAGTIATFGFPAIFCDFVGLWTFAMRMTHLLALRTHPRRTIGQNVHVVFGKRLVT